LKNATLKNEVALSETPQANNHGHYGGVALSNPPSAKMETIDL
jgi:hypothetical protein